MTLDDADALRLGVAHASMVVGQSDARLNLRYRNKSMKGVSIRGRGAGYDLVDDLAIDQGRHIVDQDDQRRSLVCVVGPEVVDDLFNGLDPVGKSMRVGDNTFLVIGVTKPKGKSFGVSQDRFITIPVRTFQKLLQERGSISISVKSIDQASLPLAQQEARNIMQPDNFEIVTPEMLLNLWRNLSGALFVVIVGVSLISLVVGGIVIMNIMLVSVTERTREIGIRKALGARRRDIVSQFLVEAITLSLVGGIIGVAVGVGLALLVGAISPLPAAVNVPAVLMGILMSSLVGVFFGSYPAMQAAKLDPIESLRYE